MIYMHTFVPAFKDMDLFQVCSFSLTLKFDLSYPLQIVGHLHAIDAGVPWCLS